MIWIPITHPGTTHHQLPTTPAGSMHYIFIFLVLFPLFLLIPCYYSAAQCLCTSTSTCTTEHGASSLVEPLLSFVRSSNRLPEYTRHTHVATHSP